MKMENEQRKIKNAKKIESWLGLQASYSVLTDSLSGSSIDLMKFTGELSDELDTYFSLGLTHQQFDGELVFVQRQSHAEKLVDELFLKLFELNEPLVSGCIVKDIFAGIHDSKLKHIILMPPFLWKEQLTSDLELLLIIPLTDNEVQFATDFGVHRLQELMSIYDVDISDLDRDSINIPAI